MANLVVMAIYDLDQQRYERPMFFRREAEGVRLFKLEVNRAAEDNLLYQYPQSFELWNLGEFDDEVGAFHEDRVRVSSGVSVKEA